MAKYVYPAIFKSEKDGFSVSFPDISGCYSQGDTLAEAIENAKDALCLMLYDMEENGEVIATAGILFIQMPPAYSNPTGVRGYITNMYTAPEYRGKGIATSMLQKLMDEARSRSVFRICLRASDLGKPVYKEFGFDESDKWMELDLL